MLGKTMCIHGKMYFIYTGTPTDIPTNKSTVLTSSRLKRQNGIRLKACDIRDIAVVSQDTLLVVNLSRGMVQLVSSMTGKVLSQLALEGEPRRVCLVGRDRAAVTIGWLQMVQLITIKGNTLVKDEVLKVSDDVYGIANSGDNLVVTYIHTRQPWLEVISMDGTVMNRFNNTGKSHVFQKPLFIASSSDGTIWITDGENNTITKMDAGLNILQTFASPLLKGPSGITAVTGDQVLVCSSRTDSLVLLQPSTNTVSTLLGKDNGIEEPHCLTYCPQEKKIFVATAGEITNIHVFQFT